ncbi:MAG: RluA family pseudouridine synthase [Acidimicrobiales bacterium]
MPEALDGERIDRVVALLTGASRSAAATLLASGVVRVDGLATTKPSSRVSLGQLVEIDADLGTAPVELEPDSTVELEIVHVDESVIVVDKQAGLVVHPGSGQEHGTLVNGLLARFPDIAGIGDADRPGVVHRLDKGTSGLLVIARTERAREALVAQLASRTAERRSLTLVWGRLESPLGLLDAPIGRSQREPTRMAVSARGKEAKTRYELVRANDQPAPTSLLRCRLETGRTHQIRVHLAAIGHPVVGDDRYGGLRKPMLDVPRPFLHAEHLSFVHPATGVEVSFDSPLPDDLDEIRARLS